MEIRKLTPDDAKELARLYSTVYTTPSDLAVTDETREECSHAWGLYDKGRLKSAMLSIPFQMMLDGRPVAVAGIGGVGTYPEDRRQGYVRMLYDRVFPQMRELGQVFSTLFPFSFPYYRRFGYELVYRKSVYELPLSELDPGKRKGTMEEVADDPQVVAALYQDFAAGRNLAIARDEGLWRRRLKRQPCKDQVYAYLCRDEEGRPRSYFQVKAERNGPHNCNLVGQDVAWTGSLSELLAWLSVFPSHAERVTLHLPTDCRPELLLPEPYRLAHHVAADYMARVVDVEPALAAFRGAPGARVVLEVRDDYLEWNNGVYEVSWDEAGAAEVKRTRRAREVALDVRTLAQLLVGFLDGAEALDAGTLQTDLTPRYLARLFPHKPLYQNDHF
jgi:predicted acetyltransferase